MPFYSRKTLVLVKLESPYGTDAAPAGADAILCKDVRVTPMNAEFDPRDFIRPYMGNSESLPAGEHGMIEFAVELQGSGTPATAPKWGRLLRACGHNETILAAPVTGVATAGAARTMTLAVGASAVDGFYNGMHVSITSGTGNGQERVIVGYNGTTKVATVDRDWATLPDATSNYSIAANVQYRPVSAAFEGATIVTNIDGLQHKFIGARGTVSIGVDARKKPMLRFRFLGLYSQPTDTGAATPDYTAFKGPVVANTANTPIFSLHNVQPVVSSFSIDIANQIEYRGLIGAESIQQTDRKPTGSIKFEAQPVATKNWWLIARNATLDALAVVHGAAAGFRVGFGSPSIQVGPPAYEDEQGVAMFRCALTPVPVVGNDESWITSY